MFKITKCKVILILILALSGVLYACANDSLTQSVFKKSGNYYINEYDGYMFSVPEGFSIDEEFYPKTIRFVSENCIIELYAEPCANKTDIDSYINYTNMAITSNRLDYFDIKQIQDEKSTILLWNRKKLSKIKNDKNYYVKIDIPSNKKVYTILVKATSPIRNYRKLMSAISEISSDRKEEAMPAIKYAADRKFNSETEAFYNKYFKNSKKVEWGIYQYSYMDSDEIYTIENRIEHKFSLLLLYSEFNEKYDCTQVRKFLDKAYSEGRAVELTLQPKRSHQEGNDLFRVLDGCYDEFLYEYAKDIADFNHPVVFRFANEMNGDWCEYSGYHMSLDTELYREMYRYIFKIFEKCNADNVIWVWNPNGKSFPDFNWNCEEMYYPGNEYVDVLGLTLYNTGNFYKGERWATFSELYVPLYEKAIKQYNMPFMITEFSCARKGGNKEKWTEQMLNEIEKFSNIKFAVWWNGADFTHDGTLARSYYINDSEKMYEIFRSYFEKNQTD